MKVGRPPVTNFCDMAKLWFADGMMHIKIKRQKLYQCSLQCIQIKTGKIHFASKQEIIKPDVIVDYNANMGGGVPRMPKTGINYYHCHNSKSEHG